MKRKRNSGQASIMIGIMMMTFILFFAFVVNTGMLVNAKINLQNAADLAAYAGASQQARLLNQISFLNYEMRRQYKKFIYRYYVLGNMAQKSFPRGGGSGPMKWSPDGNLSFGVPAVCMIYNAQDNVCQVDKQPAISIPPPQPLDQINETLRQQLTQIEDIRRQNCRSIGKTNVLVLMMWLYNVDPDFKQLEQGLDQSHRDMLRIVKGVASGVGLLPREILLRLRIRTLNEFINAKAETGMTYERAMAMKESADPISKERSVDAFLSAYNTLGDHTFGGDLQMDELLPPGPNGANLLQLKDIKTKFDTWALDWNAENKDGCDPQLIPITINAPIPIGVYKDPKVLTYYAVRLRAKAQIMFSPFGEMELSAYAAARPFGSRIGPTLSEADLTREGMPSKAPGPQLGINPVKKIPNLPVIEGDSPQAGKGWDNQNVAGVMYNAMKAPFNSQIVLSNMQRGYQAAMTPNPWEKGKYNIPADSAQDKIMRYFDQKRMLALWAPVFSAEKMGGMTQELKIAMEELFPNLSGNFATGGTSGDAIARLREGFTKSMVEYIAKLQKGEGEDFEGFKVYRMSDPSYNRWDDPENGATIKPISLAGSVMLKDVKDHRTSWDTPNSEEIRTGRIGYSVKFVSFESLSSKMLPTNNAEDLPENRIVGDGIEQLPYIKH